MFGLGVALILYVAVPEAFEIPKGIFIKIIGAFAMISGLGLVMTPYWMLVSMLGRSMVIDEERGVLHLHGAIFESHRIRREDISQLRPSTGRGRYRSLYVRGRKHALAISTMNPGFDEAVRVLRRWSNEDGIEVNRPLLDSGARWL